MSLKPRLLLVGCGHMGGAMLRYWMDSAIFAHAHIVKPSPLAEPFAEAADISWSPSVDQVPADYAPDIIILAVRPKDLAAAVPAYARYRDSLFLSLAAGKTLAQLEAMLSPSHAVLRAMPNIASEVGEGMTFATGNRRVTPAWQNMGLQLLEAVGAVAWLEDEKLFDVATALSGCGPGYVFALVESLAKAGEQMGLDHDLAALLARQTIIGSGCVLSESAASATDLRKAIGNPGTMTEAALKQLQAAQGGLTELMVKAMTAAVARARELAQ